MVQAKMKETTEAYLSTNSNDEIVTDLAYCNDLQCLATKGTTSIFVFNMLPISDKITSTITYGDKEGDDEHKVLLHDMADGTFDVSFFTTEDGIFEVKTATSDTHLGDNFFLRENKIVDFIRQDFKCLIRGQEVARNHQDNRRLTTE